MICPDCGAKNLPTADLCVSCGLELEREDHDDAEDALVGRVVAGKYELDEIIGEGSMGRVYAARQLDLDKEVAIKVLHAHVAADPKVAKRFHREARTASMLSHPNSLQIFDFGREEEGPLLYIVMELLDGPDLLELIEDDFPFSPRRIAQLVGGILLALEEAHHHGVIHRDLKAENIMVVEDHQGREHVKVCDFGIAKLVEAEGSAITVTGFVCGTPEYMAPEQARGENLDARADLYAIGCLLYQLMTEEVPFKAGSALGTITKHLTEPAEPPARRRPDLYVPRSMERVVMKALAKDPDRRYANAADMRTALEAAVDALGPMGEDPLGTHEEDPTREPVVPPEIPRPAWLAPALVVGGIVLLGIVGWGMQGDTSTDPLDAGMAAPPPVVDAGTSTICDDGSECESPLLCCPSCEGWTCAEQCTEPVCDAGSDAGIDGAATQPGMQPGMQPAMQPSMQPVMQPETMTMATMELPPGQAAFDEGRRLFLQNDVRGAIARFEEAARAMPRNAQVHKQLGRAYMRTGNLQRGSAAYRRYLELAPNAPDRALVEQMLER